MWKVFLVVDEMNKWWIWWGHPKNGNKYGTTPASKFIIKVSRKAIYSSPRL